MNTFLSWMRSPCGRIIVGLVIFTYASAALGVSYPRAQVQPPVAPGATPGAEYRVGPGDHIFLSVPQRQDLNRELTINEKGEVTLPLVGNVAVTGLTAGEIGSRLLQALREYYPSIKSVDVTVTRALSNVIFVSGDVKIPGKYSFSESINVWEAIREAGGPMPTATLTTVRVIQDRSRGGQSFVVDVQAAIDGGSVQDLPILKPGDTVLVPAKEEVYTGSSGVNVFGAVVRPGAFPLAARQDLMSALMVAGGPNERAKLSNIKIVRPEPDGTAQTIKINLDKFLEKGDMKHNPRLFSGDTVHIASKTINAANLGVVLGFITAIGTIVLLYYTIQNEVQADQSTGL
ncbi:MAG TPA: polysaccharide biosynthesis/export family protein [Candidatus Krumholzibacteria bacterium]|nr:polysaccharide biosynthesis/export family protein [Candidatus Krumholzibacteria bacterium]